MMGGHDVLYGVAEAAGSADALRAILDRWRKAYPTAWPPTLVQWLLEPAVLGQLGRTGVEAMLASDSDAAAWKWQDPFGDGSYCAARTEMSGSALGKRTSR